MNIGQFSTSKFLSFPKFPKKILSDFVRIQSLGCELAGEIVNISQDRTSGLTSEMTENRKHREISRNILQEVSRSPGPGGRRSATLELFQYLIKSLVPCQYNIADIAIIKV